jgi:AraC-like DNA-binding protein
MNSRSLAAIERLFSGWHAKCPLGHVPAQPPSSDRPPDWGAMPAAVTAFLADHRAGKRVSYRVADLARACSVCERRLEQLFQKGLKCSPKQWLQRLRMESACARLREGQSADEITFELGFHSRAHFDHEFKRLIGITARAWLRQASNS